MVVKELRRKADVDVASLVVTNLDGSLVEVVAHADTERELAAGIEAHVVVGVDADTVDEALPVSVVQSAVNAQERSGIRTVGLDIFSESRTVHHLDDILVLLCGDASAVADMHSCACTLLGGDDDHTVGSPGTVDCGCGCILEH